MMLANQHDQSIPRTRKTYTEQDWEALKTSKSDGGLPGHSELSPFRYYLHHHERWDGTGYPKGLQDEIPLMAELSPLWTHMMQ
jgi:response regulator RpfG family c-di-GMP phosphodiesterase